MAGRQERSDPVLGSWYLLSKMSALANQTDQRYRSALHSRRICGFADRLCSDARFGEVARAVDPPSPGAVPPEMIDRRGADRRRLVQAPGGSPTLQPAVHPEWPWKRARRVFTPGPSS